ncbi:CPBP family intramembrane glutamic endopeptidase [Bradyrhizobium sp. NP1]|uniref:CPBP family intramembrane glutamic endopeptidase n=1 Tax=Bradyrhizobium sp. NP1 TaxID=3049772 RepID=UPI0025A663A4|nr:CPBP family intramembrane glutamic endopeptidase [Bradyrhizobium sp. NP1]WJR77330.1 CPBP family intramembrane metalloprotease [Bradyrhizobium sp. NP1]
MDSAASGQATAAGERAREPLFYLYLAFFACAWTAYVWFVYRHVQALGESSLGYAAANIAMRLAIWVGPAVAYLHFVDRTDVFRYLKLSQGWRRGVAIGLALGALLFAGSLLRFGRPHVDPSTITWNSVLSTSIGIGFFEEIPFRGLILQKLAARMNFWTANAVTALLFAAMHLPGWILLGLFSWPVALNVFAFGFVLGAVFRFSGSLWSCIVAHSLNDFVAFILFHGR